MIKFILVFGLFFGHVTAIAVSNTCKFDRSAVPILSCKVDESLDSYWMPNKVLNQKFIQTADRNSLKQQWIIATDYFAIKVTK